MDYVDTLHIRNYWETTGWNALKNGINSFIVVDVPRTQKGGRPEPYFYLLGIKDVWDVCINENNQTVEYIAFKQPNERIVFIEETSYRVFKKNEQSKEWEIEIDVPHSIYSTTGEFIDGVGYTPVASFYRTPVYGTKGISKRNPLTNALTQLDWVLTFKTSKKYLDMYGAWPIVVHYEHECTYKDSDGDECDGNGYITKPLQGVVAMGEWPADGSSPPPQCYQTKCPVCEMRGLMGPGTEFEVPAPRDKQQADLMLNPVKFIEPSNDKLEYGVSEITRLENEIKRNTCGYIDSVTKEAMNAKQVESQYESKKGILRGISEQFEHGIAFALSTIARLRYGKMFQRSTAFLGREYFLYNTADLMSKLELAKKAGLPQYEVSQIRETYSKTKYKDDALQYQRTHILSQLEPYPDLTPTELRSMGLDAVDTENFLLKLEFANFIAKFEREFTNIVDFGKAIPFKEKINIIHQKLLSYVRDKKISYPQATSSQPNSGGNGGRSGSTNAG
jgi:hypothetical protein